MNATTVANAWLAMAAGEEKKARHRRDGAGAASGSSKGQHAPLISDPRFARLHTDPRFLRPNRDDAKITLDDRFKSVLSSDGVGHKSKGKLDKYGRRRKADHRTGEEDDLRRLYRLESDAKAHKGEVKDASDDDSEAEATAGAAIDYARGEGQLESSGDEDTDGDEGNIDHSDEESDDDDDEHDEADVVIGSAAARRRAKKLQKRHESEDSDALDADDALDGVDADQLAELDARAERTVKRESAKAAHAKRQDKPVFGGETERLAVVNMDWDHIRAIDLYKVFSSLVSPAGSSRGAHGKRMSSDGNTSGSAQVVPINGRCFSVRVFPSDFGRKRMMKENREGPPREIFKKADEGRAKGLAGAARKAARSASRKARKGKGDISKASSDEEEEDDDESDEEGLFDVDEGGDFDEEALRAYQLDRLRYYYAIATFDSPETARYILNAVDGTEMEHTANTFDLSFVPTGMTFPDHEGDKDDPEDDGWRDQANEGTAEAKYEGVDFTTDALRHSRVKLTWDADDPQRSKVTRQLMSQAPSADQLRDEDFRAYLASASEDSASEASDVEDENAGPRTDRMRALLGLNGNENAGTSAFGNAKSRAFQDGRKSATKSGMLEGDMEITFMPGLSEATARKKRGEVADVEESTIDKYKRKQREKRERRKKVDAGDTSAPSNDKGANNAEGFDDPFFGENSDDDEIDFDAALAAERRKGNSAVPSKNGKAVDSQALNDGPKPESTGLPEEDDVDDGAGHFSLKDIIKAEQAEGNGKKKSRWAKKKEKKQAQVRDARNGHEVQPGFAMDVGDARFSAGLYNDHRFALDPSHPSFVKTKGMQQLIEARRKQHRKGQDVDEPTDALRGNNDINDLVRAVKKRESGSHGASKKKQRA